MVATGCASGGGSKASAPVVTVAPPPPPPVDTTPAMAPDGTPAGFARVFDAADERARDVMFQLQCASNVQRLRTSGAFGAVASAPRNVYCVRNAEGLPLGGVFDIDTAYVRVRRLIMIRLDGARPRFTGPIDTAAVADRARLARDVTRDVSPAWRKLARPFTVATIVRDDAAVEAWVIPLSTRAGREVLGGDVSMMRGPDARLLRVTDRAATWKLVVIPPKGAVQLASTEREVAGVSDLVVARTLAERGRAVSLATMTISSTLLPGTTESGMRMRWEHARRTP